MFTQQSAAFKILRTRLKTVPFSENLKRTSSANPYSQILQVTEDGNRNQDMQNYSAINFPFLLQQFENMQLQHRNHLKDQLQSRKSASTLTLSQVFSAFAHIFDYAIYMIWVVIAATEETVVEIVSCVLLFHICAKVFSFPNIICQYELD
jgi:hypothetical protein